MKTTATALRTSDKDGRGFFRPFSLGTMVCFCRARRM